MRRGQAEHLPGDGLGVREEGNLFHDVAEPPDIAGPVVRKDGGSRARIERHWRQAVFGAGAIEQTLRQQDDVFAPLA